MQRWLLLECNLFYSVETMFKLILLCNDWITGLEVLNFSLERPCKLCVLTSRIVLEKRLIWKVGP